MSSGLIIYCPKYAERYTGGHHACSTNATTAFNPINSRDVESNIQNDKNYHEIKIAPHKLTSDIKYCVENGKPVILGEG
jgi:hypothetical protein